MRCAFIIALTLLVFSSCTILPPIEEEQGQIDYFRLTRMRARQFQSAAYLVDLRINDNGKKFSVATELYFSGDSVGFYGRSYLGKGAFKGNVINDMVTIYFKSRNEYFSAPLAEIQMGADCARPGEVLLYVFSLLSCKKSESLTDNIAVPVGREISYMDGRFDRTVRLKKKIYPLKEKLIDPICGDSIVIKYGSFNRRFPFYKVQNILFHNEDFNFRARGFMREQKYNIPIRRPKFTVNIPATAVRIDSF